MALSAHTHLRCSGLALSAALLLCLTSTPGLADERCGQLIALKKQYEGVLLTSEQKSLKVQLVAWYKENCKPLRRSASR